MDQEHATEEAEPQVTEDQLEVMDDVLDTPGADEETPAEKSDEQEPAAGAPPKDDKAEAAAKDTGTDEPDQKTQTTDKGETKPTETKKEDDPEFEVVTARDGIRKVKLSALKTTYQQHGALQARHEAVKPIFDLSKASGIPVEKMFQFLVVGIQTVHEESQRKQALPGSTHATTGDYQGPFESAQQEAELKESDPMLYKTTKALWDQNQALSNQLVQLTGRLEQQQVRAAQQAPPTDAAGPSPEHQRVNGLMDNVKSAHADYFKAHPERYDTFKQFLGSKFSSVPLSSVDESFLAFAFQTFDPAYFAAWQEEQAKAKFEKALKTRRQTFGERDSVRGSTPSSMTEQQELMADILGD